ncbi:uncharacterized protein LOC123533520 [Mercenaria mercenaria]|uniref:uncharacterized protein LOC123533520 n=1 Tax=Mercenaria mercenaria TaxID=6596 RepID=UPI00234F7400|nr:uncharacterized protein LOC123533520 [Mercenaria mercenaria]
MERNDSKDAVTSSISLGGNVLVHTSSTIKNESEEFNQMVAHKEVCHATDSRNGEEESTFAKTDTKLLNEVFVRKYEGVKPNEDLQEKNFQINQCETIPVSIGKLDDKRSKYGTDQEMIDENISDVTNSDYFGTTKENYSKTDERSSTGNNKTHITRTGSGILPSETKVDIASEMTKESITSCETASVAAQTSSDRLDDALVYGCISAILHGKIGEKVSGTDLALELD